MSSATVAELTLFAHPAEYSNEEGELRMTTAKVIWMAYSAPPSVTCSIFLINMAILYDRIVCLLMRILPVFSNAQRNGSWIVDMCGHKRKRSFLKGCVYSVTCNFGGWKSDGTDRVCNLTFGSSAIEKLQNTLSKKQLPVICTNKNPNSGILRGYRQLERVV
jgi:hypothetical protein